MVVSGNANYRNIPFFLAPLVGTFRGSGDNMVVSGNANYRKTSFISSFI